MKQLHISDFLPQSANGVVIDVRTPAEYAKGHIPGSFNIPLFSDEERVQVGTTYKQIGKEEAVELGLGIVGPKMLDIVKQAKALAQGKPVYLYCWRGGMRSGSVGWLLETAGLQVFQLVGGYKTYRNHFYKLLSVHPWQIYIVGGRTGSGKTEVLAEMAKLDQQVLDLEGLANHKGSAFGALGQLPQPTSEHFENLMHQCFLNFNPKKPVWIEGESQRIGSCFVTMQLFDLMKMGFYANVLVPTHLRIRRLVRDYASFPKEMLKTATLNIQKRLGGVVTAQIMEAIDNNEFDKVAELTLRYYDKTYDYSFNERQSAKKMIEFDHDDPQTIAQYLIENIPNLSQICNK